MAKINKEEYEILKGLGVERNWIARDNPVDLFAYRERPKKFEETRSWSDLKGGYEPIENDLFRFIQWEDEEPYEIAELIDEYEGYVYTAEHFSSAMRKLAKALGDSWNESEETEVKDIEWLKNQVDELETTIKSLLDGATTYSARISLDGSLATLKDFRGYIDQLDEQEHKNISLQDVKQRLWELPLTDRKYWLEQLNDEFQGGYIVPLGLKTTDGKEQYLTFNGSYFASRRNKHLQQTFATLEEIPEFYRDLAERML